MDSLRGMLRCGPSSLSSDRQSFQEPRLRHHLSRAEWMLLRCATPCPSSAFVSSLPPTFPVRLPASALIVRRLTDELNKRLFRRRSVSLSGRYLPQRRRYPPSHTRRRALYPKRPTTTRKRLSSTPPLLSRLRPALGHPRRASWATLPDLTVSHCRAVGDATWAMHL